jgi:xanthine/CO dehydrogenase XdhC/CoxF family maturation factor
MTHEFKDLIETAYDWQSRKWKVVLATVVMLEGSSYRRPGVRMLISSTGEIKGAISGGCVEKEVLRQSQSIFLDGKPKIMTYDGRFRLGCEGILYILLEPIIISDELYKNLQFHFAERKPFTCDVYFHTDEKEQASMGSVIRIYNDPYILNPAITVESLEKNQKFSQLFKPIFQLYIFGAEHDAVQLCQIASLLGWDVHIIAPPDEEKKLHYFKGAKSLSTPLLNEIETTKIDNSTAVMLMSHSLNKELQYLLALKDVKPAYFGLLGPSHRRERLFSEFLNVHPNTPYEFFEKIHGPAGIDIGAESASEIAVSITAEILSVVRNAEPLPLRYKLGKIHE